MKKLCAILAALACGAAAFGQAAAVVLQNQEGSPFYYVLDPKELAGVGAGSPMLATKVSDFFAADVKEGGFSVLAPEAETRLEGLADGTHLLVGFFAAEGLNELPVRVIAVQADSRIGDRFYAIFASPSLLSVPRGVGRLAQFARPSGGSQVAAAEGAAEGTASAAATTTGTEATAAAGGAANGGAATPTETAPAAAVAASEPLQPLQSFKDYTPATFTEEKQDLFEVLPIDKSMSWGHTGTRVQGLWGLISGGNLRIALTVAEGFSEKVSYFFYLFPGDRTVSTNPVTLELAPRANGTEGACLLWRQGENAPTIIGGVTSEDGMVELDIGAAQVADELVAAVGDNPSVDFTAGWYDRAVGAWEEFYYATFSISRIPVIR